MRAVYIGPMTLWILIGLGSMQVLGPLATDVFLPAMPELARDLNINASVAQVSISAFTVGMALGQLILGAMSDRFGRKPLLLLGVNLMIISSTLAGFAPTIETLALCTALMGLSSAAGAVVGRAVASDLTQGPEAAKTFALLGMLSGVGPIVGPIAGVAMMALTGTWRGIFWGMALFTIAVLVLVIVSVPETLASDKRHAGGLRSLFHHARGVLRNKTFIMFSLPLWFSFGAMFAYIASSPFIVQHLLGLSAIAYTVSFGVNGIGLLIAGLTTAALVKRINQAYVAVIGVSMLVLGGVILLFILASGLISPWTVLPTLFIIASSFGFIFGPTVGLAVSEVRDSAGTALAISGAMQFLFAGITAPLSGLGGGDSLLAFAVIVFVFGGIGAISLALGIRFHRS